MKKTNRRLQLKSEGIRNLGALDYTDVVGGGTVGVCASGNPWCNALSQNDRITCTCQFSIAPAFTCACP
jgi:hypothetical protein